MCRGFGDFNSFDLLVTAALVFSGDEAIEQRTYQDSACSGLTLAV